MKPYKQLTFLKFTSSFYYINEALLAATTTSLKPYQLLLLRCLTYQQLLLQHWSLTSSFYYVNEVLPTASTTSLKPYQQLLLHHWNLPSASTTSAASTTSLELTSSFFYIPVAYSSFYYITETLPAASTTSMKPFQQLLLHFWSLPANTTT